MEHNIILGILSIIFIGFFLFCFLSKSNDFETPKNDKVRTVGVGRYVLWIGTIIGAFTLLFTFPIPAIIVLLLLIVIK